MLPQTVHLRPKRLVPLCPHLLLQGFPGDLPRLIPGRHMDVALQLPLLEKPPEGLRDLIGYVIILFLDIVPVLDIADSGTRRADQHCQDRKARQNFQYQNGMFFHTLTPD